MRVWTALSRPRQAGQTDNEQLFSKIRTEFRQRTGSRQKKIRTNRHRTAFFTKFRTEAGQRTESTQGESGQNPYTGQI